MLAVGLSIFAVGSLAAVKAARAPASSRKIVTWGWYGLAGCKTRRRGPSAIAVSSCSLTVLAMSLAVAGGYGFRTLSELTVKDGRLEVRPYA